MGAAMGGKGARRRLRNQLRAAEEKSAHPAMRARRAAGAAGPGGAEGGGGRGRKRGRGGGGEEGLPRSMRKWMAARAEAVGRAAASSPGGGARRGTGGRRRSSVRAPTAVGRARKVARSGSPGLCLTRS